MKNFNKKLILSFWYKFNSKENVCIFYLKYKNDTVRRSLMITEGKSEVNQRRTDNIQTLYSSQEDRGQTNR